VDRQLVEEEKHISSKLRYDQISKIMKFKSLFKVKQLVLILEL
jgi:hypothetical protein